MKLKKRIAVSAMAAVLAAAMLAGCNQPPTSEPSTGGNHTGTGGGSSSSSSSSSTSTGDKKDDTATPPKEDGNKKDDAQLETRAEKFFSGKYIINRTKWLYMMQRTEVSYEENRTSTAVYTVATDGRRTVIKTEFNNGGDLTEINDWKEMTRYDFDSTEERSYVSIQSRKENPSSTSYGYLGYDILYQGVDQPSLREWADQREIGTYQVDGVKYYSETYTRNYELGYQKQMIYCFDAGDKEGRNLRYYINLTRKDGKLLWMDKYKMIKISSEVDINLLRVPEGRTIHRRVGDSYVVNGEKTPKDNYPN